jgi:hypothetical protein
MLALKPRAVTLYQPYFFCRLLLEANVAGNVPNCQAEKSERDARVADHLDDPIPFGKARIAIRVQGRDRDLPEALDCLSASISRIT